MTTEEFNPKTGAYYRGYLDACDGKPKEPPSYFKSLSVTDYNEGYDTAKIEISLEQETAAQK